MNSMKPPSFYAGDDAVYVLVGIIDGISSHALRKDCVTGKRDYKGALAAICAEIDSYRAGRKLLMEKFQ